MTDYAQLTPPLRARGIYTVRAPFRVGTDVNYTCIAIRSFKDIYREGNNPYTYVYTAAGLVDGLTTEDGSVFSFATEEKRGINIVSLADDRGTVILVPDNYITGYPSVSGIEYREFFVSCNIGALPIDYDSTLVLDAIKEAAHAVTGTTCQVEIHALSTLTSPTYEQHLAYENARAAAIQLIDSKDTQLAAKDATITELTNINETLMTILRDNNLLDQLASGE